jgi:predicted acyltransferase (DUF342 family)
MKKYEFTGKTQVVNGVQLHRIRATRDFNDVSKGELGGWIATEDNLSHDGDAWVYGAAGVYDYAKVFGDAQVSGSARVYSNAWVYGNAKVYGNAWVYGNVHVSGNAGVWDNASVSGFAGVYGDAGVFGDAQVSGSARVYGNAWVSGNAEVYGSVQVYDYAKVYGDALVFGAAQVSGNARVYGNAQVYGNARVYGAAEVYGDAQVYAQMYIRYGHVTKKFKALNDPRLVLASLNILPTKTRKGEDVYTLYKRVNRADVERAQYTSCFDSRFKYNIGKVVSQEITTNDPEVSCSQGIHLSTPTYWYGGNALIECRVLAKDIYTCMEGKIRATRCKVIREVMDFSDK